jgi:hypothetical protein
MFLCYLLTLLVLAVITFCTCYFDNGGSFFVGKIFNCLGYVGFAPFLSHFSFGMVTGVNFSGNSSSSPNAASSSIGVETSFCWNYRITPL